MDNMQQLDEERYANALYAMTKCINAGLSNTVLQTIRFEMGIDYRDYAILVQQNLKQEYERSKRLNKEWIYHNE